MNNKHEVSNIVYKTDDYSIFKLSKHNRNVLLNNHLIEEAKKGIVSPIVVNENYVIIDGQHRFKAIKEVGGEIEFIIKTGLNENDIKRMNINQKSWNLTNFVESYANAGNENYIKLINLMKENKSAPKTVLMLVASNTHSRHSVNRFIKNGTFEVKNYEEVKRYMEYYNRFINEIDGKQKAPLLEALFSIYKVKKFDEERMIDKFKNSDYSKEPLFEKETVLGVTKKMLDLYNKNISEKSKKRINYYFDEKMELIIDEELKSGWEK